MHMHHMNAYAIHVLSMCSQGNGFICSIAKHMRSHAPTRSPRVDLGLSSRPGSVRITKIMENSICNLAPYGCNLALGVPRGWGGPRRRRITPQNLLPEIFMISSLPTGGSNAVPIDFHRSPAGWLYSRRQSHHGRTAGDSSKRHQAGTLRRVPSRVLRLFSGRHQQVVPLAVRLLHGQERLAGSPSALK